MRVFWKNTREPRDHDQRDRRRGDVELLQRHRSAEDMQIDRAARAARARW